MPEHIPYVTWGAPVLFIEYYYGRQVKDDTVGHVAHTGEMKEAYRILLGKPERNMFPLI
jgi:SNF family Na+-dependent transporter